MYLHCVHRPWFCETLSALNAGMTAIDAYMRDTAELILTIYLICP
jgi:hypothetical protein